MYRSRSLSLHNALEASRCAGLYVCLCPCFSGCDISYSLDEFTMLWCFCPNVPQMRSKLRYYGRIHVCFMPEPSNWLDSAWTASCLLLMRVSGLAVRRQLLLSRVSSMRRVSDVLGAQEDGRHEAARHLRRALPLTQRKVLNDRRTHGRKTLQNLRAVVPQFFEDHSKIFILTVEYFYFFAS